MMMIYIYIYMVKQLLFAMRIPGHVQPVGQPCGTWIRFKPLFL